ncbi:uncharacterized protein [Musca autumnalis]|uniref:uncharacterized protein n=1 Tax=Musca autumnalis TaxID=221902 RepID=UPI003CEBAC7B
MNMIYLCRLCASLKKPDHLTTINDETNDLCQKAKVCCQVFIRMQDPKPKQICQECVESLNHCYKFYVKVKDAQEALETIYPTPADDNEEVGNVTVENVVESRKDPEEEKPVKETEKPKQNLAERYREVVKEENEFKTCPGRRSKDNVKSRKSIKPERISDRRAKVEKEIPASLHHPAALPKERDVVVQNEPITNEDENEYLDEVYTILGMENDTDNDTEQLQLQNISNNNENINDEDVVDEVEEHQLDNSYVEAAELIDDEEDQDIDMSVENNEPNLTKENDDINQEEIYLEDSYVNEGTEEEEIEENETINEEEDTTKDFSTLPQNLQLTSWKLYPFLCGNCDYRATKPFDLFAHANAEHSIEAFTDLLYKCCDCQQLMTHYSSFLNHVRLKHHPALKLKCDVCDKKCRSYTEYANHRKVICSQSAQYPKVLPCTQCCRNFNSSNGLQAHIKQHQTKEENKEKYKCRYCNKEYAWKRSLVNHEKTHGHKPQFKCNQCEKKFNSKSHLASHILTHTSEKRNECKICHKSFKTGTILERHQIVHTDNRPFPCSYCSKSFRTRTECTTHERVHTGEAPLQCSHCDKRFRFRSALSAHLKVHMGVRDHACEYCPKTFTDRSNYYKHMRRKHSNK